MLTLFYMPRTRATGTRVLLEELGAPYELQVLGPRSGQNQAPDFLRVNPLGKVPAIVHDGAVITEQVAITIYLADAFPERGLAPAIGDPGRGPYLRWLAFYAASWEPAIIDRAQQRDAGQVSMSPYGSFDKTVDAVATQLGGGGFIAGETMTAADFLWGGAIGWMLGFGVIPALPAFTDYAARMSGRDAFRKVTEEDAALVAMRENAGA